MPRHLATLFALFAAAIAISCSGNRIVTNPLMTDKGEILPVADPCVSMFEGNYYLSASTDTGLVSYRSADLQTWECLGPIAVFPEDDPLKTCIWASEVHLINGRYYLTYSGWNPATGTLDTNLGVGDSPCGPFTLIAAPLIHLEGKNAIDANIFIDDDGSAYLYFSENAASPEFPAGYGALRQARLTADLTRIDGPIMPVNEEYADWELKSVPRNVRCNEGPTVFKYEGTYYMTYSANETHMGDYGVGVQTAPSPLGPWTKADYNPILYTSDADGMSPGGLPAVSSPGHNSVIFNEKGAPEWIIYHRHAPEVSSFPSNDRVTCINRMWIDGEGRVVTDFDGKAY